MTPRTLCLVAAAALLAATATAAVDPTPAASLSASNPPFIGELVGQTYNYGEQHGEKNWLWRASPFDLPEEFIKTAPYHDSFHSEGFAVDPVSRTYYNLKDKHIDLYDSDMLNRRSGFFINPTPVTIEANPKTGKLYGLRMSGGVWVDEIDPESGVSTPVYNLPPDTAYYMDGSAYDPDTGRLFLSVERLSEEQGTNYYVYIVHLDEDEPFHEAVGPHTDSIESLVYNRVTQELIGFSRLLSEPHEAGWGSILALSEEQEWRNLYPYGQGFPGMMQSAVDSEGNLVIILDYYGEDTMYVIDCYSGELLDKKVMLHELVKFAYQNEAEQ